MNQTIKLLMIEDDEIDQQAFKRLVHSEGLAYDYTIATSVAEALQILGRQTFDIIVLDLRLADGTAFEVIPAINNTPFIVATGGGDESFAVKAMKAGAYDYLIKDLERGYLTLLPVSIAGALQKHRTEIELHEKSMHIESIHRNVSDGIVTVNEQGLIESVNPAVEKIFGYPPEEVLGQNIDMLLPSSFFIDDSAACICLQKGLIRYIDDGYEATTKKKDGSVITVGFAASEMWLVGRQLLVVAFNDISDRKRLETLLTEQALFDGLTGLYNKRSLPDLMREELSRGTRHDRPLSVLMVDIDYFKKVNDNYGHQAGDQVLRALAQLMTESLRSHDRAVRYGGEEFIVLLPETDRNGAVNFAERLRRKVAAASWRIRDNDGKSRQISITVSIGIAAMVEDGHSAGDLIAAADKAMYEAKRRGRNCVVECGSLREAER